MASTFTGLGTELMTTGENAGTWGTKTNTNLSIVEQISGGYIEQSIAGSADTTTLSVSDGSAGAVLAHRIIKFTGTITGNQIVTIPLDVQQLYVLVNGTSGAYTVQFKYASGSGSSVTFAATDKGSKLVYATADDATNPNLVDSGIASTGDHDLDGNELILDADGDTSITADTDDQIDIKIAGADDFQFTANTFTAQSGSTIAAQALTATTVIASGIVKTDDTTEATSTTDGSLQTDGGLSVAKDAVLGDDVKLLSDSAVLSFGADSDTTLTHTDGTGLTLNGANKLLFRDTGLTIGSNADGDLDIVSDGTAVDSINIESAGGITLDAGTAASGVIYEDDGTEMFRIFNSSSDVILQSKVSDKDLIIKGNDGGSDVTALTFDMSDAGKATFGGNVVVTGDLTVSGDDITMGTNTAGNLLIADGTNFNSVAATSLSEISTIANDDVFLAVDTSGGGLKKVARSTVVSGLATSAAISNVSEDSTPQLGGNLDLNGSDIVTTSNADLELAPNGTGHVTVKGNTNSGAIQFNCESKSHGQIIIAQPHSAGVTNTLTLPAGASSTLVSLVSTDTLTNKTLTSAVLNTGVSGSAILDEDNMASNSATQLATQQSIKAYVDSQVATADTLAELSDTTISSPSSGHILVYDGSNSFDNVAVSGDVTIAANGAVTIAATAVENSMLAGSIADSKLNTISTAGKVALTALEIDGGTDIGADLTTSDLIVVDDGAGGTNRKAALSRIVTLMSAQGFVTDDPTALAIALG